MTTTENHGTKRDLENEKRCFACDKPMRGSRGYLIRCTDEQTAFVGPDCFKRIRAAGSDGYQPPLGGPRLFEISQQLLESADD